jgi:hypothetical protein
MSALGYGTSAWPQLATGGDRWIVPVGAGVGKLFVVEGQPINAEVGVYYNLLKPEMASPWQFRFNVSLLFPR